MSQSLRLARWCPSRPSRASGRRSGIGRSGAIRAEADRDAKAAAQATADAELARIRSELDALKKAPPAVAPPTTQAQPTALAFPNPVEDPEGFARAQDMARFNERLMVSEDILRDKEGDDAVDAAMESFKAMVAENDKKFGPQANPLRAALTTQRNPYRWMFNEVKKAAAAQGDRRRSGRLPRQDRSGKSAPSFKQRLPLSRPHPKRRGSLAALPTCDLRRRAATPRGLGQRQWRVYFLTKRLSIRRREPQGNGRSAARMPSRIWQAAAELLIGRSEYFQNNPLHLSAGVGYGRHEPHPGTSGSYAHPVG